MQKLVMIFFLCLVPTIAIGCPPQTYSCPANQYFTGYNQTTRNFTCAVGGGSEGGCNITHERINVTDPGSEFYSSDPSSYPVLTIGGDRDHYQTNFPIYWGLGVRPLTYVIADAAGEAGFGGVAMPGASTGGYGMCTGGNGQYGLAAVAYGSGCIGMYSDVCTLSGGCDDTYPSYSGVGPIATRTYEGSGNYDAKICLGSNDCDSPPSWFRFSFDNDTIYTPSRIAPETNLTQDLGGPDNLWNFYGDGSQLINLPKVDEAVHADSADEADQADNAETLDGKAYNELFPIGTIIMFAGTYTDNVTIPCWFIADGTDGTVNLVGQFVRGGSTSGATGGSDTNSHNHTVDVGQTTNTTGAEASHTHTYTQVPNHVHVQTVMSSASGGLSGAVRDTSSNTPVADSQSTANPTGGVATGTTNAGSSHTHSIAIDPASVTSGAASDTNNIPSYYTLIFVQRRC